MKTVGKEGKKEGNRIFNEKMKAAPRLSHKTRSHRPYAVTADNKFCFGFSSR